MDKQLENNSGTPAAGSPSPPPAVPSTPEKEAPKDVKPEPPVIIDSKAPEPVKTNSKAIDIPMKIFTCWLLGIFFL